MKTIWKYELQPRDVQRVAMPKGARLLSVHGQHVNEQGPGFARSDTVPMLWALVNPDAMVVDRLIGLVGTGNPAPEDDDLVYVGSALCGPFVWHVFDGGEVG